jgi:hypothetical protein
MMRRITFRILTYSVSSSASFSCANGRPMLTAWYLLSGTSSSSPKAEGCTITGTICTPCARAASSSGGSSWSVMKSEFRKSVEIISTATLALPSARSISCRHSMPGWMSLSVQTLMLRRSSSRRCDRSRSRYGVSTWL